MGGGYNEGEAWDHLSELGQEAIRHRSNLATLEEARLAALKFDVGAVPANGKVPFLVVHGGRDGMYDMHQVQRMVDHFGDQGQLMLEPLGNHVLHNLAYRVRPAVADWVAARIVRE
jgi:2,6-dihydroxypseudooxynicotine hydrolase